MVKTMSYAVITVFVVLLIFAANTAWKRWLDHKYQVKSGEAQIKLSEIELEKVKLLTVGSSMNHENP